MVHVRIGWRASLHGAIAILLYQLSWMCLIVFPVFLLLLATLVHFTGLDYADRPQLLSRVTWFSLASIASGFLFGWFARGILRRKTGRLVASAAIAGLLASGFFMVSVHGSKALLLRTQESCITGVLLTLGIGLCLTLIPTRNSSAT